MDPTVKSSLLWGLIGSRAYLVLIQAYHLLTDSFVGTERMVVVALLVGVFVAILTHVLRPRIVRVAHERRES